MGILFALLMLISTPQFMELSDLADDPASHDEQMITTQGRIVINGCAFGTTKFTLYPFRSAEGTAVAVLVDVSCQVFFEDSKFRYTSAVVTGIYHADHNVITHATITFNGLVL